MTKRECLTLPCVGFSAKGAVSFGRPRTRASGESRFQPRRLSGLPRLLVTMRLRAIEHRTTDYPSRQAGYG